MNGSTNEWEVCAEQDTLRLIGFPDVSTGGGPESSFSFIQAYPGQSLIPIPFQSGGQYYVQTDGLPSDTYAIAYTFKNAVGAVTTKVRNLRIFASPVSAISVANSCIVAAINFTDASTLPPILPAQQQPPQQKPLDDLL